MLFQCSWPPTPSMATSNVSLPVCTCHSHKRQGRFPHLLNPGWLRPECIRSDVLGLLSSDLQRIRNFWFIALRMSCQVVRKSRGKTHEERWMASDSPTSAKPAQCFQTSTWLPTSRGCQIKHRLPNKSDFQINKSFFSLSQILHGTYLC